MTQEQTPRMRASNAVSHAQYRAQFQLNDYVYPEGAYITYSEYPKLTKAIPRKKHEHVRAFIRRLRQVYKENDIYITVPSKITASWHPKQ